MRPLSSLLAVAALALCACQSAQTVDPEALYNDALVAEVPNLGQPFPSVLTSGQLSREQFADLVAAGVTTFINLRGPDEPNTGWEAEYAQELGVTFVRLPVSGKADINWQKAGELDALLAQAADGPVMVSCGSSNRVGALFALRAVSVSGLTPGEAMTLGKSAGLKSLEPVVAEQLLK